ncbi:tRNA epoxyqueuosine(34) reductase QueG [Stappia sp. GBMRC 2046]|uniref:Epoxyqueuosine reductase n=1 Tax=Stappia sediminis TaxID=2692190 RepID=A0A7X3LX18_9HYPH|nr:tRNA epoxyqueuosine(34) reductase QueG [Stappia sediminis]MXN66699.1 tRNA epoxyqueuosine(34) reductase QueG [Stappia sediminis]
MTPRAAARLKDALQERARELRFDLCRVAPAGLGPQHGENLRAYVAKGHHGTMAWMEETLARRQHPQAIWPDARSVIVLAISYTPGVAPNAHLSSRDRATISVYARHRDYHDVVKGRLKELAQFLLSRARAAGCEDGEVKVFVDTAPVMEKPLGEQAGVGWQGKHTNLVSRDLGSWFFLAEIFTTLDLPADDAEVDHCGSCRACLDACPTKAFPAPYQLDARRCISYLTIEHKGPVPHEFRKAMGNRIYGCDDCLAACPWNKFAVEAREAKLQARDDLLAPRLADLLKLDDAAFRALFSGSPIKRIGRDRFIRNVLIAAGNSADRSLLPDVERLLHDPAPVVRGAAVWALSQLATPDRFAQLQAAAKPREGDPQVLEEWAAGSV